MSVVQLETDRPLSNKPDIVRPQTALSQMSPKEYRHRFYVHDISPYILK